MLTCATSFYCTVFFSIFYFTAALGICFHTFMYLCLHLAECFREFPCGNGFLREDRQGDWQPCGSSECCHGGRTRVEGETHLILSLSTLLGADVKRCPHIALFIFLKYSYRVNFPLVVIVNFSVTEVLSYLQLTVMYKKSCCIVSAWHLSQKRSQRMNILGSHSPLHHSSLSSGKEDH